MRKASIFKYISQNRSEETQKLWNKRNNNNNKKIGKIENEKKKKIMNAMEPFATGIILNMNETWCFEWIQWINLKVKNTLLF